MKTVDELIDLILKHEGGYVNHPSDRGGPTNWGITQANLSSWRGRKTSIQEVKTMSREEARTIYRRRFFEKPRMDLLPPGIQAQVFDLGVNAGPSVAIRQMQEILNEAGFACVVDGTIGSNTSRVAWAAWRAMGTYLTNALVERRIQFYEGIIRRRPSQAVFRKGWLSRANSFVVSNPVILAGAEGVEPKEFA